MKVVVVGGGGGGFSAAMVAKRVGADEVVLIERTDMLGGIGLVAGIGLFGTGAFVGLTEEKALGGASLYYWKGRRLKALYTYPGHPYHPRR